MRGPEPRGRRGVRYRPRPLHAIHSRVHFSADPNYYDIKDKINFAGWLEYFTDGIIDELLRVSKEMRSAELTPETALKTHDKQIIDHIRENGFITDREYSAITKRAKATRNKDLNRLIGMGLIKKLGKGKSTYYKLTEK